MSTLPIRKFTIVALVAGILLAGLLGAGRPTVAAGACDGTHRGNPTAGDDKAILFKPNRTVWLNPIRLANDPDGCQMELINIGKAQYGSARLFNGAIIYEHAGAMIPATDVFPYTIRNTNGLKATGTVTVLLYQDLRPPVAADYTISVLVGRYSYPLNVVKNSVDPDGWGTGIPMLVIGTTAGYIERYEQDTVYVHAERAGVFRTTYQLLSQATGLVSTGTITVYAHDPRPPVAPDYTATTKPGQMVEVDVLSKAGDPDVDAVPVGWWEKYMWFLGLDMKLTPRAPGRVAINEHSIFFTPNADARGPVVFYYRIRSNVFWGAVSTGKVTILVEP